jgi:transposase
MDAWQQYVTSFSERFRFDKGQCDAARSCLEELQERARAHRDRYSKRIIELERCIAAFTGDPSEQQRIQRDLIELYGPIDSMFAELTQRLEKIPAKDQRERASGPKAIPGGE